MPQLTSVIRLTTERIQNAQGGKFSFESVTPEAKHSRPFRVDFCFQIDVEKHRPLARFYRIHHPPERRTDRQFAKKPTCPQLGVTLDGTAVVGVCDGEPQTSNRPPSSMGKLSAQAECPQCTQDCTRSAGQSQISRSQRKNEKPGGFGEHGQLEFRSIRQDFRCLSNGGVQVEAIGTEVGLGDAAIGKMREPKAQDEVGAFAQGKGPAEAEADGGIERGSEGEGGGSRDGVVGRVGPAEAQSDFGMKSSPPGPFEALKPSCLVPQRWATGCGP